MLKNPIDFQPLFASSGFFVHFRINISLTVREDDVKRIYETYESNKKKKGKKENVFTSNIVKCFSLYIAVSFF